MKLIVRAAFIVIALMLIVRCSIESTESEVVQIEDIIASIGMPDEERENQEVYLNDIIYAENGFLMRGVGSKKLLSVRIDNNLDGANVIIWEAEDNIGNIYQQWIADSTGDGTNVILNKGSGKSLDIKNKSLFNGANVQQWEYAGTDNQQWIFESVGDNQFIIINSRSGRVLDVRNKSDFNGANVQQWKYKGTDNQKWTIEEAI